MKVPADGKMIDRRGVYCNLISKNSEHPTYARIDLSNYNEDFSNF